MRLKQTLRYNTNATRGAKALRDQHMCKNNSNNKKYNNNNNTDSNNK